MQNWLTPLMRITNLRQNKTQNRFLWLNHWFASYFAATLMLFVVFCLNSAVLAQPIPFFDFLFHKITPAQIEYHLNQRQLYLIRPLAIQGQNYIADCVAPNNKRVRLKINMYNEHIESEQWLKSARQTYSSHEQRSLRPHRHARVKQQAQPKPQQDNQPQKQNAPSETAPPSLAPKPSGNPTPASAEPQPAKAQEPKVSEPKSAPAPSPAPSPVQKPAKTLSFD